MVTLRPTASAAGSESPWVSLVVGLLILFVSVPIVGTAIAVGPEVSVPLGTVMLAVAWLVPTARDARMIRVIMAMLGVVALAFGVLDLVA